ncbi:MAG: acyl-CoA thioesterase [Desulfovibrionaceae bacterium]
MQGKPPAASRTIMSHRLMPQDTNPAGNVHGGVILKLIDTAAGTVAARHARSNVVTVSIDRVDFLKPVHVGELVTIKANLNFVGSTSMEVGVRVEAENLRTGDVRYTNSAYLTFVALDDNGKPRTVAPLILETDEDHRRHAEAMTRRELRKRERASERIHEGAFL